MLQTIQKQYCDSYMENTGLGHQSCRLDRRFTVRHTSLDFPTLQRCSTHQCRRLNARHLNARRSRHFCYQFLAQ